jgi:hypothetical protein
MNLSDLLKQNTYPATSGIGQMTPALSQMTPAMSQLTEAEMAALKFQQMKAQMDEMSRMRQMAQAYGMGQMTQNEGNTMVNAMRQMNPMGNTMQNIPANVGGMSARNAQPPMDINTLLKYLGYR